MQKPNILDISALIVTILLLTGIIGLIWSGLNSVDDLGPRLLDKDQRGRVYLLAGGHLLLLDKTGGLLKDIPLETLGLGKNPVDMQVLGDESVWIGDYDTSNIFVCDLYRMQCRPRLRLYENKRRLFPGVFHFAVDERQRLIYVANTLLHRLEVFSWEGRLIRAMRLQDDEYGEMCYPNGIRLLEDGNLAIADTNQHRIIIAATAEHDFGRVLKNIFVARGKAGVFHCDPYRYQQTGGRGAGWVPTPEEFADNTDHLRVPQYGRYTNYWPIDMLHDGKQRWWVVNASGNFSITDILIFDNDGRSLQRVVLPEALAVSFDILDLGDKVLIPDNRYMRIYAVSYAGERLEDFGDETVRGLLQKFFQWSLFYPRVQFYSNGFIVLGLIGAVVVVIIRIISAATGWMKKAATQKGA